MNLLYIIVLVILIMTIRSFLIVIGAFKDPILASFEKYGENETIFSPIYGLIMWTLLAIYLALFIFIDSDLIFGIGVAIALPLAILRDQAQNFLQKHHTLFRVFPRWYFELAKRTDRNERRRIAYLWLRLPYRTRMIYNTNTVYFYQWVDQVILTIAR